MFWVEGALLPSRTKEDFHARPVSMGINCGGHQQAVEADEAAWDPSRTPSYSEVHLAMVRMSPAVPEEERLRGIFHFRLRRLRKWPLHGLLLCSAIKAIRLRRSLCLHLLMHGRSIRSL